MDLSIIIVNYNTKRLTFNCINSIYKFAPSCSFEVIVVDNNSKDGSADLFSKDSRISFIETYNNWGFGRANNIGFQSSSGEIILLLNSDTLIINNILDDVINYIKQTPSYIGCVGTILLTKEKERGVSYSYFPDWKNEILLSPVNRIQPISPMFYVDSVSGANMFIKRSVIESCGLFDKDFFMYYEDTEMSHRFLKKGYKSVIYNKSGIIHLEGASTNFSYNKIIMMTRSYFIYLKKTLGITEFLLARILIAIKRSITMFRYPWTLRQRIDYLKLLYTFI